MQIATITKGPHLLWNGGNHKRFGIKVKATNPNSLPQGVSNEWSINDSTLLSEPKYKDFLGLSDAQYSNLLNELKTLSKN